MEDKPWEFSSISVKFLADTMDFLEKTLSYLSSLSSDPLFSTIITLYTLLLLYFPKIFLGIVFSPVLISTGILLLTLLRLGAIQRVEKEFNSTEPEQNHHHHDSTVEDRKWVSIESNSESKTEMGLDPNPFYAESFVEWDMRAPLEVIYEVYEGEEDEQNDDVLEDKEERYPSLLLYYPESDSDSSSDCDFPVIGEWEPPERLCFRWDEEDRDGLIEIELDNGKRTSELFHFEEDNLIEIDISPARMMRFPARNGKFSGDDCSNTRNTESNSNGTRFF
ncbi:hypothetical protein LOK49_LG09G01806 [Camellia lanceoleosa]|uniref:Uncharacterized protein n=1 Tax=Camellia lanceoleosa TaxID=1840588 RepID=A0ACC0GK47_9ERIC|nr:hypothetical protein LOK49_LG09G01806 [Camellia lanceoleosa]